MRATNVQVHRLVEWMSALPYPLAKCKSTPRLTAFYNQNDCWELENAGRKHKEAIMQQPCNSGHRNHRDP